MSSRAFFMLASIVGCLCAIGCDQAKAPADEGVTVTSDDFAVASHSSEPTSAPPTPVSSASSSGPPAPVSSAALPARGLSHQQPPATRAAGASAAAPAEGIPLTPIDLLPSSDLVDYGEVDYMCVAVDRGWLATTRRAGGEIVVWDAATGRRASTFAARDSSQATREITLARDGTRLAMRIRQTAEIMDVEHEAIVTSKELFLGLFPQHNYFSSFSDDGKICAFSCRTTIGFMLSATGDDYFMNVVRGTAQLGAVAFVRGTGLLAAGVTQGKDRSSIWLIDPKKGTTTRTIEVPNGRSGPLRVSADGRRLAIGRTDDRIALYDTSTWEQVASFYPAGPSGNVFEFFTRLDLSFDGRYLVATGSTDTGHLVSLYDSLSDEQTLVRDTAAAQLAFLSNRVFAAAYENEPIRFYDAQSKTEVRLPITLGN